MKIGCMVWKMDGLELDFWEQIDWVKEHGFEEVSFHTCKYLGNGKGIEPHINDKSLIKRLREALNGFADVDIHAPFGLYDITFTTPNPLIREASIETLKESIVFTKEIGGKVVTFHAGDTRAPIDKNEYRRNLLESFISLDKIAEKVDIKLAAELTSDYDLLEEAELKNIGLTIDTGHVSFDDGAGYREFGTIGGLIERFGDKIFHMHIHDYDGENDHLPAGKGNIDFDNIIISLKKIGYEGSLCLEPNPERNTVEDILRSKEILREIIDKR